MIAREVKRKKLVKKYAAKRKSLLDEFNAAKDPMERLEIHRNCLLYTSPSPRDTG